MSTTKQVTDAESVELSTAVQLSPHTPTDKVSSVDRKDIKESPEHELISLDEVYTVTGQESFQVVAANCREWLKNSRLHRSGFQALEISGSESMVPSYDRFNAIRGSESFFDTLKKGFVTMIKAVKRFIMAVVDWIIERLKSMFGFSKTARQLQVIAENSKEAKAKLVDVLSDLAKQRGFSLDTDVVYSILPGDMDSKAAFRMVLGKNKTALEQAKILLNTLPEIKNIQAMVDGVSQNARAAKSIYIQAIGKLRDANRSGLEEGDVKEFLATLENDITAKLDIVSIRKATALLVDKLYGIELGDVGIDKSFKDNIRKYREELSTMTSVTIKTKDYTEFRKATDKFPEAVVALSEAKYDAGVLNNLKDLVEIKDAEFIHSVSDKEAGNGLIAGYAAYSGTISEYTASIEHLMNMLNNVRGTMAGVIGWANGVDRLMVGYISGDLKRIMEAEASTLSDEAIKKQAILNEKGKQIGSNVELDYDRLFLARFPDGLLAEKLGPVIANQLYAKYDIIKTINTHLKEMGINVRF